MCICRIPINLILLQNTKMKLTSNYCIYLCYCVGDVIKNPSSRLYLDWGYYLTCYSNPSYHNHRVVQRYFNNSGSTVSKSVMLGIGDSSSVFSPQIMQTVAILYDNILSILPSRKFILYL
jgi:hypothetical protein